MWLRGKGFPAELSIPAGTTVAGRVYPPAGVQCLSTAHEVISSVPLFDHTEDALRNGTATVLRLCGTTPLLWHYHATLVPERP